MRFRIVEWEDMQHYKSEARRGSAPLPWLKLRRSLLQSEAWVVGTDSTRAAMIALMLLADHNGEVSGNPAYIQRAGQLDEAPDFQALVLAGFIEQVEERSSSVLANATEHASDVLHGFSELASNMLDEEDKTRQEKTREEKRAAPRAPASLIPLDVVVPHSLERIRPKLEEWARYRRGSKYKAWAVQTWEKTFQQWNGKADALAAAIDQSIANGWQGLFEKSSSARREVVKISTGDVF